MFQQELPEPAAAAGGSGDGGRLRPRLTAQLYGSFQGMHAVALGVLLVLALILREYLPLAVVLGWTLLVTAAELWQGYVVRSYRRNPGAASPSRWLRRFGCALIGTGAAWGTAVIFLFWPLPHLIPLFLAVLNVSLAAVSLSTLGGFPRIYVVFAGVLSLPMALALMLLPPLDEAFLLAGGMVLAAYGYLVLLSRRMHRARLQGLRSALSYHGLSRQLHSERGLRREVQQRLAKAVAFDPVTGLPNQKYFLARAQDLLSQQAVLPPMRRCNVLVMLIDLDGFTQVNSSFGRSAGDYLLAEMGARLRAVLPPAGHVARLGNDEFAVAVSLTGNEGRVWELIRQVRDAIHRPVSWQGHEVEITATMGFSLAPKHGMDIETVLKKADIALRLARQSATDQQLEFRPEMETSIVNRFALQHALRRALSKRELSLAYQPIVQLHSGRVVGAEALLRWHSHEFGPVSPIDFIPLAEQTGLINDIGAWVLREACQQACRWVHARPGFGISVNVSVQQLADMSFPSLVEQVLLETGLPAQALRLEITESVVMTDPETVLQLLAQIRRLGVGVAMDDFGTGYSSLSYLTQLNIDYLKLDKSFISRISESERSAAIVRSTIALAGALRLQVIAEGIETADGWLRLRGERCEFGQGFYFSRALPAAEFELLPERFALPRAVSTVSG